MHHINQLLPAQPHEMQRSVLPSENYETERLERAKKAVAEIFNKLQPAMPGRFSSMYPTEGDVIAAGGIWAIGLIEARLTPKQISYGLTKAISGAKYCPDLPDFIALCKPTAEDLGLPSLANAYAEACRNAHPVLQDRQWSHPAVYHAAKQVGFFELRSLDEKTSRPMFEQAYERTVDAVLSGDELPEIPKALEDLTSKPKPPGWKPSEEDKAKGRAAMAEIMATLGGVAT